jgi:chemotaxis protein CheD
MSYDPPNHFSGAVYFDRAFGCDAAKILPGEFYCTRRDIMIVTVLGSCVSACIRDRVSGIGGMNHFMLPDSGESADVLHSASARYGIYAMDVLIEELLKMGARRETLEAKVFGGGAVLRGITSLNVGERNALFVREYLKAQKITIAAEDLNDVVARKVYFFPRSGRVMVKKIREFHNETLANRELEYAGRLQRRRERT